MVVAFLLLGASLATRGGWLSFGSMNPDESQYAAHASFLVRSGQSAFEAPVLHVYTHWIFGILADWFGEYEFYPIRVVFLLLGFSSAYLIYEMCRLALPAWISVVASLFFLHLVVYFEGLSANREWLCLPLLLGAHLIYLRYANRWVIACFVAGFIAALAVWIKEQAILLCAPIGLDLGIEFLRTHQRRAVALRMGTYAVGLGGGLLLPTLPMLAYGTLGIQFDWILRAESTYAATGYGREQLFEIFLHNLDGLYRNIPFRRIFAAAYVCSIVVLARSVIVSGNESKSEQAAGGRVPRLAAIQLLCALFAIQLGRRFFLHYYLFAAAPLVILLAFTTHWLWTKGDRTRVAMAFCLLWILAALIDVLYVPSQFDWQTLAIPVPVPYWRLAALFLAVFFALWTLIRRGNLQANARVILPRLVVVLLAVDAIVGSARVFSANERVVAPTLSLYASPGLEEWWPTQASRSDLLFVWGWRPEIYWQSGLGAATRFAACVDVVANLDHSLVLEPHYDQEYVDWLIADLESARPRWIVDAALCSIYGSGFRLDYVPPFRDYLAQNYSYVANLDGCDVYERREPHEATTTVPEPNHAERKLRILDALVAARPWQSSMLVLNRADILAQDGRKQEACAIYRELLNANPGWPQPIQRLRQLGCEK